jgi:hypothetical protein
MQMNFRDDSFDLLSGRNIDPAKMAAMADDWISAKEVVSNRLRDFRYA